MTPTKDNAMLALAERLWRHEAEGVPALKNARDQASFSDQSETTQMKWLGYARVALASTPAASGVGDLALPKAREVGEPVAWMVEGPLGGGECFSSHASCDWGKKITPLYALASTPLQAVQAEAGRPLAAGTREEIARIVDPDAINQCNDDPNFLFRANDARKKADAILSLASTATRRGE